MANEQEKNRESVPFQSAYDWMDDERNRVGADSVQSGVEWVGLVIAIVILCAHIVFYTN